MRRVHILHGFNVRDSGRSTTGVLVPLLSESGFQCIEHKWGWRGLFGTWLFNSKLVDRLIGTVEDGDCVVAHSDGCNIAMWAAERGAKISRMVLINPALDSDKELPGQVESCLVFKDPKDMWVRVSSYLPFNRWGRMGATGPSSNDLRYTTISHKLGHSGIFKTKRSAEILAGQVELFLNCDLGHVYANA